MSKQSIITAVGLILLLVTWCGCTDENPLKGLKYVNKKYNFGLNPPENWTANESVAKGDIIQFITSDESNRTVALVIIISEYGAGNTLESHAQWEIELFENDSNNFTLVSQGERTVNSYNAYEIVYTYKQIGIFDIKNKEVLIDFHGYVLSLIYTAPVDSYDIYLPDFEKSINSFKIG